MGRAARLAALLALAIAVATSGCDAADPCVQPLADWCGEAPCEDVSLDAFETTGRCDDLTVASDLTVDSYASHVFYFDGDGALVAVHLYTDDPTGSCTSDWFGAHVVCAETCEEPEGLEVLECEG